MPTTPDPIAVSCVVESTSTRPPLSIRTPAVSDALAVTVICELCLASTKEPSPSAPTALELNPLALTTNPFDRSMMPPPSAIMPPLTLALPAEVMVGRAEPVIVEPVPLARKPVAESDVRWRDRAAGADEINGSASGGQHCVGGPSRWNQHDYSAGIDSTCRAGFEPPWTRFVRRVCRRSADDRTRRTDSHGVL